MSRVGSFGAAVAVFTAVALSSCGGHTHSNVDEQLLAASRLPWQAPVRHDAQGFCNAVTPTFSSEFLSSLAGRSGRRTTTSCTTATARQLRDEVLVLEARLQLAREAPHSLQPVAVHGHNATVTFRAHPSAVSSSRGSPAGTSARTETATMKDPGKRPITVDLVLGSDGRWRVTIRTGIAMTVVR